MFSGKREKDAKESFREETKRKMHSDPGLDRPKVAAATESHTGDRVAGQSVAGGCVGRTTDHGVDLLEPHERSSGGFIDGAMVATTDRRQHAASIVSVLGAALAHLGIGDTASVRVAAPRASPA